MIDMTGEKYARLTVIEFVGRRNNSTLWRCKCDCGNERIVSRGNLLTGNTKSCGCLNSELSKKKKN